METSSRPPSGRTMLFYVRVYLRGLWCLRLLYPLFFGLNLWLRPITHWSYHRSARPLWCSHGILFEPTDAQVLKPVSGRIIVLRSRLRNCLDPSRNRPARRHIRCFLLWCWLRRYPPPAAGSSFRTGARRSSGHLRLCERRRPSFRTDTLPSERRFSSLLDKLRHHVPRGRHHRIPDHDISLLRKLLKCRKHKNSVIFAQLRTRFLPSGSPYRAP